MTTLKQLRVELSAAKARGYFEHAGRGLLITRPATEEGPFGAWMRTYGMSGTYWENRYVTLADLKAWGCPGSVVHLVEAYDPMTEAVVAIEFEPGADVEPQVVALTFGGSNIH